MYIIKSRYYSSPDQFGESFVVTSDNGEKDLKLGIGTRVKIVAICSNCENDALISYGDGTCLCGQCMIKKRNENE
jgi:hypothetical protein